MFFDCTADLVGQLDGNGQKGKLHTDAPRRKFLAMPLSHSPSGSVISSRILCPSGFMDGVMFSRNGQEQA